MPTLDVTEPEQTSHWETVERVSQRLSRAVGADHRVRLRAVVCLVAATVCMSVAPLPWSAVGLVALLLLALDWTRK